jgi:hypothetical protein
MRVRIRITADAHNDVSTSGIGFESQPSHSEARPWERLEEVSGVAANTHSETEQSEVSTANGGCRECGIDLFGHRPVLRVWN